MRSVQSVSIGDVCTFLNGGTPSRSEEHYFQGDIPWITGADITASSVTSARSFITDEAVAKSATNRVPAGTVLLVTRTSVGKVATAGVDLCFSQDITALKPDAARLHAPYLVEFLKTQERHFARQARGATIKGITRAVVSDVRIPLPSLPEQRRIAEVLDRADALRAKRRAALAQLDSLTQSIFLDMFGSASGPASGLRVEPLGKYLSFLTSGGRGWAKYYAPMGSRFIRSLDVRMNCIGNDDVAFVVAPDNAEATRTRVRQGDVLLTITGSRIGRVAPVPPELDGSYISQHVAILRLKSTVLLPAFLSYFLSLDGDGQRQIEKFQYGQTKPGLNFEQIRRFEIPVASMDMQLDFARHLTGIEKLKATHRAALAELDALFASLQHRAFRGEL